ncbi:nitroreductase family protein [Breznakiella homolactica]|uniref:Nitroreductase family protein n=1 Tax=Breznakiella homolactica TaxID=2798577 RepID=A0A7T7XKG5_9SPIR|nr:nitroreductase family protein [Breznakiella homolactica]QQO07852.1 nitroreductase family protein [Breznakiella homolactica]
METLKTIAARKSTRSFNPDKRIAKADLDTIVAAGCAAPVGGADYKSLHLTVIADPAALDTVAQAGRQMMHSDTNPLYNATALVVVSASAEQKFPGIEYANAGCIVENMLLAAADLGIDSVYIWGVSVGMAENRELWEKMGVPEGFRPVSAAALGYGTDSGATGKELSVSLATNYV